MKKKTKKKISFDEIIKTYYGRPDKERSTLAIKMEERLFHDYGKPQVPKGKNGKRLSPVVLSLSYDQGETLLQYKRDKPFEEYIVPPRTEERFEEYVVPCLMADHELEEYVVRKDAVSGEGHVDTAVEVIPAEKVSASQEYAVDLLYPLKEGKPARSVMPSIEPSLGEEKPQKQASLTVFSPPPSQTNQAKTLDDDFVADMKSILSGKKVFDPATKKAIGKDQIGPSVPRLGEEASAERPVAAANNDQAIFDKIAQSMQYANAYNLGTVELENRFADFDRIADLEKRAAEQKKGKEVKRPEEAVSSNIQVETKEFLQDLDAMRKQGFEMRLPSSFSSAFALHTLEGVTEYYSRPFFDTGEHVLGGEDLYVDQLRVGKAPGVLFSYGQIIAMGGDLYGTLDEMMNADVAELKKLKSFIERNTAYYKGNKTDPSKSVSNKQWDDATNGRYLKLAEENYSHFSPDILLKTTSGGARNTNQSEWEDHHARAIKAAQEMMADPQSANRPAFLERPLIINAFGDHFLTDAFSSGHLLNKEGVIRRFKDHFFDGNSLKPEGKKFFATVAKLAFKGNIAKKFSRLETYKPLEGWWNIINWNPNIDSVSRFEELLIGVAEQRPDSIGNIAAKSLHDHLNKNGIKVTNDAGDGPWILKGDGFLDPTTLEILRKAVRQSIDNLHDPSIQVRSVPFDLHPYFSKVWKYVPKLTKTSEHAFRQLVEEYTTPTSEVLQKAAAQVIHDQVDLLIKKLIEEKALKYA
ncbi:MAG: hypothetical protein CV087_05020 [Candidatus Brocadia sp. WS118]|nr:MAG: hypothetical protein CV087_05020 [Candidatus Brocadia sp. WS118]